MSEEKERYWSTIKHYTSDCDGYRRYILNNGNGFLARWDEFVRTLANNSSKTDTIYINDEKYPLELADEVLHLRSLSYDTLEFVETLVNVWMAQQTNGRGYPCESRGVNKFRSSIKVSELIWDVQECAEKVLDIQNFDTPYMTDEGKEKTFWLIPYITLNWYEGGYYINYTVDWDVARLGYPEQYGEIEEAVDSLQLRQELGSYEASFLKHVHGELHAKKAKEEYDKWMKRHANDEIVTEGWCRDFRQWLSLPSRLECSQSGRLWTENTLGLFPGYGYYRGDDEE